MLRCVLPYVRLTALLFHTQVTELTCLLWNPIEKAVKIDFLVGSGLDNNTYVVSLCEAFNIQGLN